MIKKFKQALSKWQRLKTKNFFLNGKKGIEKENLRITTNGKLASKNTHLFLLLL